MTIVMRPLPGSRKVYVTGSKASIRVSMREIALSSSAARNGEELPNGPVRVYDAGGPYTDESYDADARRGAAGTAQMDMLARRR